MGRDIGTNVYSNNFEPQVMGLLDARTRVDTKADLTKEATWASSDGNTYAPVGIRVSVTDDSTNGNNGVYMLLSEDYAIASNWMKIGSDGSSGGSAEFVMVDLSTVNTIPGTYVPDRYLMGEFIKIQDALSIDMPFFVYQFNGEFGQFPTVAIMDGSNFMLSILYRDEVWFVNFDGGQYTTSKGGTSPLTNVKVLTTSGLLNTSRKGNLYLSSSDVTIWKNIELGRDIIVYSGSIAQEKQYVPLSISSNGTGSGQVGRVTYMLNGSMYSFKIEYVNPSTYTAGAVTKIENSGDKTIYLTTDGMLDIGSDTELNQQDIDAITKLYTENNSSITNIVYVGSESGGNQFLVPLSCYSDFGGESPMDVLFLHPWQQKVYHTVIDIFATPPIAYDPEEITFDSGNSSSDVKVLSTPQLINPARTTDLQMSPNDVLAIRQSTAKNIFVYNAILGTNRVVIPMVLNAVGNTVALASIIELYYIFGGNMYVLKIKADGQYFSASPIQGILQTKQDVLKSGTNIKTINGQSILGSGNLQIAGGSGSAEVLKVSLYDLGYTNGTYTISKGDYSYDSIVELDNNRSSGKIIYAYEIYGVMGMFNISIDDYNNIFYVDFLDKKLKVEYNINRDDTITCDVTDVTKHDLSLDVRISNNKIQYRIHEVVPNGYICFYRKKRCRNSKTDRPHVNKYTIPDFYFSSKIRTLGFPAIKKKYMIPVSNVQVNTWTDFPMEVLNVFSTNSATLVSFTGTVHANPCHKDTTTNNWNKYLAVLNMGLAYNVVNTNFVNGIKENNAYPTDIIQSGDMVKFKCRLMVPYKLRYTMY